MNYISSFIQVFGITAMMAICLLGSEKGCREGQSFNSSQNPRTIFLQHYMTPCTSMDLQWCLIFKESGNKDWQYSYEDISGFDYEWGFTYELEVENVKEENSDQDSGGGFMKLVKIIRKEKIPANTKFKLKLGNINEPPLINISGNKINFLGLTVNTVLPDTIINQILEDSSKDWIGLFSHSNTHNEINLIEIKND